MSPKRTFLKSETPEILKSQLNPCWKMCPKCQKIFFAQKLGATKYTVKKSLGNNNVNKKCLKNLYPGTQNPKKAQRPNLLLLWNPQRPYTLGITPNWPGPEIKHGNNKNVQVKWNKPGT